MEQVVINSTKKTPRITLDPSGVFNIRGRFIHENPVELFEPVIKWLKDYKKDPQPVTIVNVDLEYFSCTASRYILKVLETLLPLKENNRLIINWYYEDGDEDILERGQYYETLFNIEFNFIEYT